MPTDKHEQIAQIEAAAYEGMKERPANDPRWLFWRGVLLGLEAFKSPLVTADWVKTCYEVNVRNLHEHQRT